MLLSIIVPVYNRVEEMKELLQSLSEQQNRDFEVIVVEDGSTETSESVVNDYSSRLLIRYFTKPNSGPGLSRNFGAEHSSGEYLVFLDSDCVVPPQYTQVLHDYLDCNRVDTFGGPDAASEEFSDFQKAVSYSMTSFFTTGGIRGGKRKLDRFFPRSFNMGYRRETYNQYGGFSSMRIGEDMELSYRLVEKGCSSVLIPQAYVYHKRRSTSKSFFRQVFRFGMTRINLYLRYPSTLKLVHFLPSLFTIYTAIAVLITLFFSRFALVPVFLIALIWFLNSTMINRSVNVGILSIKTSFIQLFGYGSGLLYGAWIRLVLKKSEEETFSND
ncbi:MAG: glycosyltransferase [Rikenellaceae bacterium]